jgi:RNA polymerase sigma factor (TIGR02999 family)
MDMSSGDHGMESEKPVTDRLAAWAAGDRAALDEVMLLVYTELYQAARRAMSRERPSPILDPTSLVQEVYLRLVPLKPVSWEGRGPFFALAARLMRNILVEHARAAGSQKRGGGAERVTLAHPELQVGPPNVDLLDLHNALLELEALDPTMVKIIDLRFFTGATEDETAEALGMSRSGVQREWALAKRFLADRLSR